MEKIDRKLRLVLFAGPNGSGKTTLTKQISKHNILPKLYLNPDDIAREMNPADPWKVRIAAGRKALELRKSYLEDNKSFVIETTLSGVSELSFIKDAISRGYKVSAIFVAIQGTIENILRVQTRAKRGGHYVPPKDIQRRRERSLKNLSVLISILPRIVVVDNTYKTKTLLRKNNNKITYISDELPNWFLSNFADKIIKEYHLSRNNRGSN